VSTPPQPADRPRPHLRAQAQARYPREHGSPFIRALFLTAGLIAFTAGILGVFLPLLPATPLLILAAFCFARAYRPFHEWMLSHRWIGPMLREWYVHRSIPYATKILAIVTMLISFGASIIFFVRPAWLKLLLAACAVGLAVWLYRIPSRPKKPAST
jgi:uncharacterized membrane protein YbaN (DUF454 family)